MRFEWEQEGRDRNMTKHGVSFEEALTVFYDPLAATFDDPDHSTAESSPHDRLLVELPTTRAVPY